MLCPLYKHCADDMIINGDLPTILDSMLLCTWIPISYVLDKSRPTMCHMQGKENMVIPDHKTPLFELVSNGEII